MLHANPNPTLYSSLPGNLPPDWSRFDAIEVHPVYCDPAGWCETCDDEPEEATFWSVYGHVHGQGLECITDVPTARLACIIATLFERSLRHAQD